MRQYLMQLRRCGAVDLRAWRIDRKRKVPVLVSLRSRPSACVPQRRRLPPDAPRAIVGHPGANFRCPRINAWSGHCGQLRQIKPVVLHAGNGFSCGHLATVAAPPHHFGNWALNGPLPEALLSAVDAPTRTTNPLVVGRLLAC